MSHEHYVKRSLWVAKCETCGMNEQRTERAKEIFDSTCRKWIPFVEESVLAPEYQTDVTPEQRLANRIGIQNPRLKG